MREVLASVVVALLDLVGELAVGVAIHIFAFNGLDESLVPGDLVDGSLFRVGGLVHVGTRFGDMTGVAWDNVVESGAFEHR